MCMTNDLCQGVDCTSSNQCVDDGMCDPADGTCIAGSNKAADTACTDGGGTVCDGAGNCVACNTDGQCPSGDVCTNHECVAGAVDPDPATKVVTMGCTNNVTPDISILPFELTVDPTAIVASSAFTADLSGVAVFSETFLDAGLSAVPGLKQATLVSAAATVQVRSGATGAGVVLNAEPIPLTCSGGMNAGGSCTTAADCPPGAPYVSCAQIVLIPIIDGTGDACAACNAINATKAAQCTANGYCVAPGDLPLQLETVTGASYTADASGSVLFGFDDQNTGATLNGNGTYALPPAIFGNPVTPNGVRVIAAVLQVALQCTMAVDSGGPDGVGVPDAASPTPDSALISFDIQ
jgi:hypothetical protein